MRISKYLSVLILPIMISGCGSVEHRRGIGAEIPDRPFVLVGGSIGTWSEEPNSPQPDGPGRDQAAEVSGLDFPLVLVAATNCSVALSPEALFWQVVGKDAEGFNLCLDVGTEITRFTFVDSSQMYHAGVAASVETVLGEPYLGLRWISWRDLHEDTSRYTELDEPRSNSGKRVYLGWIPRAKWSPHLEFVWGDSSGDAVAGDMKAFHLTWDIGEWPPGWD